MELCNAIISGEKRAFTHVVACEPHLVNQESNMGVTPLHLACSKGRLEMVMQLVSAGAKVNKKSMVDGRSPLHHAASHGHVRIVYFLLRNGACIDEEDSKGHTPLHVSIHNNHLNVCILLLAWGSSPLLKDKDGNSAIHSVILSNCSVEFMKTLVDLSGPSLFSIQDKMMRTPLHWSIILRKKPEACFIVRNGGCSSMYLRDVSGNTPEQLATRRNCLWFFKILKDHEHNKWWEIERQQPLLKASLYILGFMIVPLVIYALVTFSWKTSVLLACAIVSGFYAIPALLGISRPSVIRILPLMYISWLGILLYTHVKYFVGKDISSRQILSLGMGVAMVFFLVRTIRTDPGTIAKTKPGERLGSILKLTKEGLLSQRHYCNTCGIRKPLRSKHCKICNHCVAKFNHHCPWTGTCIGENNIRHFVLFVCCGSAYVWIWIICGIVYIQNAYCALNDSILDVCAGKTRICYTFAERLCMFFQANKEILYVFILSSLFKPWFMIALLALHIYQVARDITSNELQCLHRLEYLYPSLEEAREICAKNMVDSHKTPYPLPYTDINVSEMEDQEDLLKWPLYRRPFINPFDYGMPSNIQNFLCNYRGTGIDFYNIERKPPNATYTRSKTKIWCKTAEGQSRTCMKNRLGEILNFMMDGTTDCKKSNYDEIHV